MDNVIDATQRFPQSNPDKQKVTPLDRLRQLPRTERGDATLLATRLGEIAQKLSPDRPQAVAKQWFDKLWAGDRWAKRKRHILFKGERAPDPIASNGADWAALVEQAAASLYPDDSTTSIKERARVSRDVLRGTSFLPASNSIPLRSDSVQSLMASLCTKVLDAIELKTELVQLWEVLDQTPFDIHSKRFDQPTYSDEKLDNPLIAAMHAHDRYDGDAYSRGPLGKASRLAEAVSVIRYRQFDHSYYRFEPGSRSHEQDWAYPIMRLGRRGHIRRTRMFVIPHEFVKTLPFDQEFDDGEKALDERVMEWLIATELMSGMSAVSTNGPDLRL